jgi:S-adenosylmethionine hydrolase
MARVITLTTDFGARDWFVGTMKGVILGIQPRARIVDITHDLAPGDIPAGAFALAAAFTFFPPGTVHVAVVDPGVGSARAAIAIRAGQYQFVGPDNGVLSWAVAQAGPVQTIRQLTNAKYFLPEVSRTFHGRDVFAPVAAHLSAGLPSARLGPSLAEFQQLPRLAPTQQRGKWSGAVVYVDHFGNAITNLPGELLRSQAGRTSQVRLPGRRKPIPVAQFYQGVAAGSPAAVVGSTGFLELAINGGSAAARLRLKPGARVVLEPD